jgi:exonuclease III
MKFNILLLVFILALSLSFVSCGENTNITTPVVADTIGVAIGTDETFDVVTWNIENFPKHNPETTNLLKTLIPNLKADCVAIQEVHSNGSLTQLVSQMPNWSFFVSGDGDTKTAILFNTTTVQVDSSATILTGLSNPFPRPPLLVKLRWQEQEIILISMHLKAFGDNVIDTTNPDDEEMRRLYACELLDGYVTENFPQSKVIIVGDMNDMIQDAPASNVFEPFLNKPADYLFADMPIAQNYTSQTCSYPGYFSHIDHILISNELFDAFDASNHYVKTIQVENYVTGGWSNYDQFISDHRPVGARFKFTSRK